MSTLIIHYTYHLCQEESASYCLLASFWPEGQACLSVVGSTFYPEASIVLFSNNNYPYSGNFRYIAKLIIIDNSGKNTLYRLFF